MCMRVEFRMCEDEVGMHKSKVCDMMVGLGVLECDIGVRKGEVGGASN